MEESLSAQEPGGLGVLDLNVQNSALLLKNLDKFYNHKDIPWVHLIWNTYYCNGKLPRRSLEGSFWWKAHLKLIDIFKGIAKCLVGNGKSTLLWSDMWNDGCLQHKLPHLLSYEKNPHISVNEFLQTANTQDHFFSLCHSKLTRNIKTLSKYS